MQLSLNLLTRQSLAEFTGTYALVLIGCGAIMVNAITGALGHMGVALAFGLIITLMVSTTGHISGAHFNPAVTMAFALTRHFPWRKVLAYWLAQLAGAVSAALTLYALFGNTAMLGATIPLNTAMQSLILEALMTAMLMLVIMAVATDSKAEGRLAALIIGAAVGVSALWGGPISGASLNPARSFGPALVAGVWQAHWLYWSGPIVGAALGAFLYTTLRAPEQIMKS